MSSISNLYHIMSCDSCETRISSTTLDEKESNKCIEDHFKLNPFCLKWKNILNNDKENNAKFIQKNYKIMALNNSTICYNCRVEYSNIGNINKHYKNHPECFKICCFINSGGTIIQNNNIVTKFTHSFSIIEKLYKQNENYTDYKHKKITTEQYYKYWPNSLYNIDLQIAKEITINYLKTIISENKTLVMDLYGTLLYRDPICLNEINLGNDKYGNNISIWLPNNEIILIATYAKELGFKIIILSSRSEKSREASIQNMKLFNIPYDTLIINTDQSLVFKEIEIKKLKASYNIVCTIGCRYTDCFEPFSVKLPDPDSLKVEIYSENDIEIKNFKGHVIPDYYYDIDMKSLEQNNKNMNMNDNWR